MSYLVALDDGHGMGTPGKRTPVIPELGRSIRENEFNRAVVKLLDAELKRCGFRTLLVAPTDDDTPLSTRTNRANAAKADIYVSVHYNAGGGSGIETYHFPGSSKGRKLAQCIHKHVKGGTPQRDRGVKSANFHVLRETKMPAVLVEYGFMDEPGLVEERRMLDPSFQKECAVETAKGICEYFGVPYKSGTTSPSTKPPMYDIYINDDEKDIYSTAYQDKLLSKIKELLQKGTDTIHLYRRDSKRNPKNK